MVTLVHSLQGSTEQLPSFRVAYRCDHQALAIGGKREGGIRADVEEIKDPAVDHQGETISMLGQPLDHVEASLLIVITLYHRCASSSSGRGMEVGCVRNSEIRRSTSRGRRSKRLACRLP